ncbi:ATP synthase F1 subunit epsilon [Reyranella sp. CPCC 100927]|uniref:ATP synthase F1 subunit epsilon n=1 Tax=Reyranella sp. CPCC 100927 TaxID=2599616 RepID=UPI0011B6C2AB|nr:ATP synthase F1 subunit epsilon [Reyranella sp. CPCC 100927]TWT15799.1 ATP synthase F1 subunit epsilon [Reyranella sp. CPCC 100927]
MAKVAFSLVLPERELVTTEADMVVVPGSEGDFGVLPGHIPMITTVRPGVIELYDDGKVTARYMVAGGFAEVTPERCTVLAEEATPLADVTGDQLANRLRQAEEALEDATAPAAKASAEQAIAVARELQRAQAYYAGR